MKYLFIILTLFISGCCFSDHPEQKQPKGYVKYHFNQKVRITGGFYKGFEGVVRAPSGHFSDCRDRYEVLLKGDDLPSTNVNVCDHDLEAM